MVTPLHHPGPSGPSKMLTCRTPRPLAREIQLLARAERTTVSDLIRQAIADRVAQALARPAEERAR